MLVNMPRIRRKPQDFRAEIGTYAPSIYQMSIICNITATCFRFSTCNGKKVSGFNFQTNFIKTIGKVTMLGDIGTRRKIAKNC